jgi:hypothetical protein
VQFGGVYLLCPCNIVADSGNLAFLDGAKNGRPSFACRLCGLFQAVCQLVFSYMHERLRCTCTRNTFRLICQARCITVVPLLLSPSIIKILVAGGCGWVCGRSQAFPRLAQQNGGSADGAKHRPHIHAHKVCRRDYGDMILYGAAGRVSVARQPISLIQILLLKNRLFALLRANAFFCR